MGDLLCRVRLETPVKLNRKQKDLLREFAAEVEQGGHDRHSPQATSWLDGVKKFFDSLGG
jgi:molecular chaperone DnaJ